MFKSKKEFAMAMMEGRKFKKEYSDTIFHYNEEFAIPFRFGVAPIKTFWNDFDKVIEVIEPKWYENIQEIGRS
jgi:hypothetical protein